VVGTAIHNADEMYDSPDCVTYNDSNTYCLEMHNAEVLVAGTGIDKADENIYNPNANDNDVNQGIAVSFNAHMSNSSGHDMPNVVVVVACIRIDKPDGHNDNPNANDNDPISVSPYMLNAEVAICSMGFQNEVALNAEYEGNVVSAKEAGENEFFDDFMDVLNDEESLSKVSLDDMNVDGQEEKLIDILKHIDLWVDLMWCLDNPTQIGPWYPVAWRDVEKVCL
nr:hypothetical protein [Tanacetum cinerariifolium]